MGEKTCLMSNIYDYILLIDINSLYAIIVIIVSLRNICNVN